MNLDDFDKAVESATEVESIANSRVIGTARAIAMAVRAGEEPGRFLLAELVRTTEEQIKAQDALTQAHLARVAAHSMPSAEEIEEQRTKLRGGSIINLGARVKRLLKLAPSADCFAAADGLPKDGPEGGDAA